MIYIFLWFFHFTAEKAVRKSNKSIRMLDSFVPEGAKQP